MGNVCTMYGQSVWEKWNILIRYFRVLGLTNIFILNTRRDFGTTDVLLNFHFDGTNILNAIVFTKVSFLQGSRRCALLTKMRNNNQISKNIGKTLKRLLILKKSVGFSSCMHLECDSVVAEICLVSYFSEKILSSIIREAKIL